MSQLGREWGELDSEPFGGSAGAEALFDLCYVNRGAVEHAGDVGATEEVHVDAA
jgi:hypothetical protein